MKSDPLDDAVKSAETRPSLVLVDFDHTLVGINSTEEFFAFAQPRALISLFNLLVRKWIPWRLTFLPRWYRTRDYFLFRIIIRLFPNNLARWAEIAPQFYLMSVNKKLERVLVDQFPVESRCIITFGLEDLVIPLLKGSQWEHCKVLATSTASKWTSLRDGKLETARRVFSCMDLSQAMFVTDSTDDSDLLGAVAIPVLLSPFHVNSCIR